MKIFKTKEDLQEELRDSAKAGNLEKVKELISRGVDLNAKDNLNWTALHHAAFNGHLDIVKELIKNHADLNAKNNIGRTASIIFCI